MKPPSYRSSAVRRLRSETPWIYALYGLWTLDYRAGADDRIAIVVQVLVLVVSGTAFGLRISYRNLRIPNVLRIVCGVFIAFAVESSLSGLWAGQTFYAVSALALPLFLFVMYALYAYDLFSKVRDPTVVINTLITVLVVGVVARFFIVVAILKIDLVDVRYEILSSGAIAAAAAMVASLFSSFSFYAAILSMANTVSIILSVTRTYVALIAGMIVSMIVLCPKFLLRFAILRRIGAAICLVIPVALYSLASDDGAGSRWMMRLSNVEYIGFDVTAAARKAEVASQFDALSTSVRGEFFGFGLAAPNTLSGFYAALIRETPGVQGEADLVDIGYGHNIYMGLLYTGGLLFGGSMVATLLFLVFHASRTIYLLALRMKFVPFAFVAVWGALTILGFSIAGMLGGILGDRGYAIWFGTSVGMMVAARKRLRVGLFENIHSTTSGGPNGLRYSRRLSN